MENNTEPAAFAPQSPWHPLAPACAVSGWPMEAGRAQGYLLLGSSPETTCAQTGSDFPQAVTIQARIDVLLPGDTEELSLCSLTHLLSQHQGPKTESPHYGSSCQEGGRPAPVPLTHFKEEVEPQEGATGNNGKASSISAGNGLWHLRGVLGREGYNRNGLAPALASHLSSR